MSKAAVARILLIVGLVGVAGSLTLWKYRSIHNAAAATPAFEPFETVQVVQAKLTPWRQTAELSGTVVAKQSVTIRNELAGTVKEVLFDSGKIVDEGQVILTMDTTTEQADLRALEATVEVMDADISAAEATKRLAEANLRRLSQAIEVRAGAVSETEMDQARSTLDAASAKLESSRAQREQARAHVDQMKATIAKKTIRAPFRAVAGLRNVHQGQYLAEGTSIVGLQSVSDDIYLDFALPQEQAYRAKPGMVVMADAPMLGTQPLRIEVVALDAVADPTTRNVRVRAVVPNKEQRLVPGMFVDITVPVGEEQDYITVPSTAVRRASFGDHVFLVTPDQKDPSKLRAHQQFVKIGPMVGDDIIVLDGLKAGDEVAANGSFKLREGVLVMKGGAPSGPSNAPGRDAQASSAPNH